MKSRGEQLDAEREIAACGKKQSLHYAICASIFHTFQNFAELQILQQRFMDFDTIDDKITRCVIEESD